MFNFPRVSGMEAVLKYLASARYKKRVERGKRALALLAGAVTSLITFTPDYTHLSPAREIVTHSHGEKKTRIASHRQPSDSLVFRAGFCAKCLAFGLIEGISLKGLTWALNNGVLESEKISTTSSSAKNPIFSRRDRPGLSARPFSRFQRAKNTRGMTRPREGGEK